MRPWRRDRDGCYILGRWRIRVLYDGTWQLLEQRDGRWAFVGDYGTLRAAKAAAEEEE